MTAHEDRIRQRAYEIWEREGRPDGNDLKHWIQAFEEIAAQNKTVAAKAAAPKKAAKPAGSAKKSPTAKNAKKQPAADTQAVAPISKTSKPGRGVTTH